MSIKLPKKIRGGSGLFWAIIFTPLLVIGAIISASFWQEAIRIQEEGGFSPAAADVDAEALSIANRNNAPGGASQRPPDSIVEGFKEVAAPVIISTTTTTSTSTTTTLPIAPPTTLSVAGERLRTGNPNEMQRYQHLLSVFTPSSVAEQRVALLLLPTNDDRQQIIIDSSGLPAVELLKTFTEQQQCDHFGRTYNAHGPGGGKPTVNPLTKACI